MDDEKIAFDIVDPNEYISKNGDDDEIALTIQIWDSNRFADVSFYAFVSIYLMTTIC